MHRERIERTDFQRERVQARSRRGDQASDLLRVQTNKQISSAFLSPRSLPSILSLPLSSALSVFLLSLYISLHIHLSHCISFALAVHFSPFPPSLSLSFLVRHLSPSNYFSHSISLNLSLPPLSLFPLCISLAQSLPIQ